MSNMSPCNVEVKSKECTYLWKIEKYSTIPQRQGGNLRSVKFSAFDDDLYWCLEHTLRIVSVSEMMVSFNLRPDCYDDLRKYESVSGCVDYYVLNGPAPTPCRTTKVSSYFSYSFDERNHDFQRVTFPMSFIKQFVCEDELSFLCNFTYRKRNDTVPISSLNNSNAVRILESRLSSDMERCFTEDRFKDVTISVKGKEYRAHKNILATRSTVFDKMLSIDMLESKKNHIDITDFDHEPFEEMLYYIYTGKVKNLDESAFELLPLADKYDLKELWSMCEEVLVKKLTTDNAAKILILADTQRAAELKAHTIRFIKENYESCDDFNSPEFWKNLAASNAKLLNEMIGVFCKRQKLD